MLLDRNLSWKTKVTTVRVNAQIFPLPYEEHHTYIMYQWVKTCLSDLPHPLHIQHTHLINTTASALHATLVTAHQQIPVYSMVEQSILHLQNNKWFDTSLTIPSLMSPVKKNTSQQLHWMMTFGYINQYQTDTYASMNIHNHMTHAPTLVHTALISYTSLQNMHQHHITWT